VARIPEGYAILTIDQPAAAAPRHFSTNGEDNSSSVLALTGPGAVRYGPNVCGFGEAYAFFVQFPGRPRDWDRDLNPLTAADVRQRSLASAIKHLRETLSHANEEGRSIGDIVLARYVLAQLYAFLGEMGMAIEQWQECYKVALSTDLKRGHYLEAVLGIAHLHKSEMDNDVYRAPGERCLFPMSSAMRYQKTADSEKAVAYFQKYLSQDPDDIEAKWLLNLTCITLGEYPAAIPQRQLIPLDGFGPKQGIGRFVDVAPEAGVNTLSYAGGIIVDDFANRGRFDIVLSEADDQDPNEALHYFHNNGDGTFSKQTERSGLKGELGGLNIIHTDYDNDGCLDILVLRGAWADPRPLSLFRGHGDGTFTDVTSRAGLTELVATGTAVWADINNNGLPDLFVGNERGPSYLFLNKGDGTFKDISAPASVDKLAFTKAVVAGDYDNDGYVDFYCSNMSSNNFLYHNEQNNTFKEVAGPAGVQDPLGKCFATWFFDYDNDGWLDLFVTSFYSGSVDENIRTYLGLPFNAVTLKLYQNLRNGTFEDVTKAVGLDKVFMPMGANFGDVDNDGFLDIYLGTGNPSYGSLVPNVLLRNDEGKRFVDITASSGTGELHKGHGIAFADMSNTGQQDILTVIGGVAPADRHAFSNVEQG
jgi:tetratricopeptide (TPR) repeat protein